MEASGSEGVLGSVRRVMRPKETTHDVIKPLRGFPLTGCLYFLTETWVSFPEIYEASKMDYFQPDLGKIIGPLSPRPLIPSHGGNQAWISFYNLFYFIFSSRRERKKSL